ncbi:MAG: glycerol-3-phosphate acyltransferase, partial [Bacteroidia bacterium]|nr:glycerol-3-phosphate acyltransferase [Bacteroidia bacterium]
LQPEAAGFCFMAFAVVFLGSHFISLSSMVAGIAFPFYVIVIEKSTILSLVVFSMAVAILVLITHQKNIQRLVTNKESKMFLFKKRTA